MGTPDRAYVVTRAVSPYSARFERGDQMSDAPREATVAMSAVVKATPWMRAVVAPTTSCPPLAVLDRHANSLRALTSIPSAMCGRYAAFAGTTDGSSMSG